MGGFGMDGEIFRGDENKNGTREAGAVENRDGEQEALLLFGSWRIRFGVGTAVWPGAAVAAATGTSAHFVEFLRLFRGEDCFNFCGVGFSEFLGLGAAGLLIEGGVLAEGAKFLAFLLDDGFELGLLVIGEAERGGEGLEAITLSLALRAAWRALAGGFCRAIGGGFGIAAVLGEQRGGKDGQGGQGCESFDVHGTMVRCRDRMVECVISFPRDPD